MTRNVQLVLDSTALNAYAHGEFEAISVGEVVQLAAEGDGIVAISSLAWLEAYRDLKTEQERWRLQRLIEASRGVVTMVGLPAEATINLAVSAGLNHLSHGQTHTLWIAGDEPESQVATFDVEPLWRPGHLPRERFLDLGATWEQS